MNMWFRTLLVRLFATRRPAVGVHDVARMRLRVLPTDIDVLRHVNNGVYLSLMDLGRIDLLLRAGVWQRMTTAGIYPVVTSSTITYRRSLDLWTRYTLETRVLGYDDRACYLEQRFVVDGEIFARGVVKGRFLRRTGGTVTMDELTALLGVDRSELVLPEWVARWERDAALPSARSSAPSEW